MVAFADLPPVAKCSEFDIEEFEFRLRASRNYETSTDTTRPEVAWAPQQGSQITVLGCPLFEVLYHGTRGPGKSDVMLMDYAQHVGIGLGGAWRGVIFRRTYPELADIVAKSEKWFRMIFPGARFNRARMSWEFPDGEALLFRHMRRPADYTLYHGHELPFIGWEELTNWANDQCYRSMFSCCRSSVKGVPKKMRANTNPWGVGVNWIKQRFQLWRDWRKTIVIPEPIDEHDNVGEPRAAVHGHIDENKILVEADPHYKRRISAAATNSAMREAWLDGSWDVIAGGMFDDVWHRDWNEVAPFEIPSSWRIDRAMDWGSSSPFSIGWYAVSDGSDLRLRSGRVISTLPRDLFRVREWYGWNGRANEGCRKTFVEVAQGIIEREILWGWRDKDGCRVQPGPADTQIFNSENGTSIAQEMAKPIRHGTRIYEGVRWTRADKRPGSRIPGWEMFRRAIQAARPEIGVDGRMLPRERPGFFVVAEYCPHFLRTVLTLPRDEKNMDDADTDAEDHAADESRYRVRAMRPMITSGATSGTTY